MSTRMRSDLGVAQPFAAPATETEVAVGEIMAEFLKLDHVGRDDPFADLGLDSFTALQVSLAAEERLGLAINTNWLSGDETLRTLCTRAGAQHR
jgi:acyl carrier protein